MPILRDVALVWARLALAALADPSPVGLVRAALAEAVRRGEARRDARPALDPEPVAREVARELEPFLEQEAGGAALPAVVHTVRRLLRRHAPGAAEINHHLRDPRRIVDHVLHQGAGELTGLGPDTEIPLVETLLLRTYQVLLRQPPVLDALRPDYERRQLRRQRATADTLEVILERQKGLMKLVDEALRQT